MKTLFSWLCAIVFGAGGVYFYLQNNNKEAELGSLRPQAAEVQNLRSELVKAQAAGMAQTEEITRLKTETGDAVRLRNEVRQLREEKAQKEKQLQAVQAASQTALKQAEQQAQQLKAANQQIQASVQYNAEAANRGRCVNNLRMLDGAVQQWALENNKPAGSQPRPEDIAPFLKDNQFPACPSEGVYALGTVGGHPTCSHAGHELPKE